MMKYCELSIEISRLPEVETTLAVIWVNNIILHQDYKSAHSLVSTKRENENVVQITLSMNW